LPTKLATTWHSTFSFFVAKNVRTQLKQLKRLNGIYQTLSAALRSIRSLAESTQQVIHLGSEVLVKKLQLDVSKRLLQEAGRTQDEHSVKQCRKVTLQHCTDMLCHLSLTAMGPTLEICPFFIHAPLEN